MGFHKQKEKIEKKKPAKDKKILERRNVFPSFCPKNVNFQNKIKTSFMPQPK